MAQDSKIKQLLDMVSANPQVEATLQKKLPVFTEILKTLEDNSKRKVQAVEALKNAKNKGPRAAILKKIILEQEALVERTNAGYTQIGEFTRALRKATLQYAREQSGEKKAKAVDQVQWLNTEESFFRRIAETVNAQVLTVKDSLFLVSSQTELHQKLIDLVLLERNLLDGAEFQQFNFLDAIDQQSIVPKNQAKDSNQDKEHIWKRNHVELDHIVEESEKLKRTGVVCRILYDDTRTKYYGAVVLESGMFSVSRGLVLAGKRLASLGLAVAVLELPGHGLQTSNFRIGAAADQIREAAAYLRIRFNTRDAVIMGQSAGAAACAFACLGYTRDIESQFYATAQFLMKRNSRVSSLTKASEQLIAVFTEMQENVSRFQLNGQGNVYAFFIAPPKRFQDTKLAWFLHIAQFIPNMYKNMITSSTYHHNDTKGLIQYLKKIKNVEDFLEITSQIRTGSDTPEPLRIVVQAYLDQVWSIQKWLLIGGTDKTTNMETWKKDMDKDKETSNPEATAYRKVTSGTGKSHASRLVKSYMALSKEEDMKVFFAPHLNHFFERTQHAWGGEDVIGHPEAGRFLTSTLRSIFPDIDKDLSFSFVEPNA